MPGHYILQYYQTATARLYMVIGTQQYVHADNRHNRWDVVDVPFQGSSVTIAQGGANNSTAAVRVIMEWCYKETNPYWTLVDFKRKMRVGESYVNLRYVAALLLHNLTNCFYPNTVS